jgi:hypothetical protein
MSLRVERSNLLFSGNFELYLPGDCFGGNATPRNDIKFVIYLNSYVEFMN